MINDTRPLKTGVTSVTHHPELYAHNFRAALATPFIQPAVWDQTMGMVNCGMMGNATYGLCVECEFFHGEMFKALIAFDNDKPTYEAGFKPASTEFVEDIYFAYGTSLGEPGKRPDEGSDPGSWAAYAIKTGHAEFAAEVAIPTAPLSDMDLDPIFQAAVEFRGVGLTINCPSQMQQQFGEGVTLTVGPGNEPDPEDGHGIWLCTVDMTKKLAKIATWGKVVWCTFEFLQACLTSVWVFGTKQDAEAAGYDFAAWQAVAQTMPNFLDAVKPATAIDTVEVDSSESLLKRLEDAIKGVPGDVKELTKALHKAADMALERVSVQEITAVIEEALRAYGLSAL